MSECTCHYGSGGISLSSSCPVHNKKRIVKSFSGGMKFIDKSRGQPIAVSKKIAKKITAPLKKNKKT